MKILHGQFFFRSQLPFFLHIVRKATVYSKYYFKEDRCYKCILVQAINQGAFLESAFLFRMFHPSLLTQEIIHILIAVLIKISFLWLLPWAKPKQPSLVFLFLAWLWCQMHQEALWKAKCDNWKVSSFLNNHRISTINVSKIYLSALLIEACLKSGHFHVQALLSRGLQDKKKWIAPKS